MQGDFLCKERLDEVVNLLSLTGRSRLWNLGEKDLKKAKGFKKIALAFLGLFKKITIKSGLWFRLIFKKQKQLGEFDVAFAFRQCSPCYSFVLNKVKAKKKIGFVHGELSHMGDISSWKKFMPKFDKIAYVANAVKEQFVKRFPEFSKNACTIYNTFDFERIYQLSAQINPIEFNKNKKNIVTVARVSQEKRIEWVPNVCKKLKEKLGNVFHWYILGDGPEAENVKEKIEELQVGDVLTMVGSVLNPYAILKEADFSVLPSKTEAYPMVVTESFALGIPLVVTDFPSIYEMMKNNVQGLIVESNIDALVEGVAEMINNSLLLEKCKQNITSQSYDNEKSISQLMQAIEG
ncbi:MAG: glycosyltransferase [Clostridia bacterium]|nr:glycosyltransferase [Clostridia bacterium]